MDDKDKIIKLLEEKVERLEQDLREARTAKITYVPYERPWQPSPSIPPWNPPYSPWTYKTQTTDRVWYGKGVLS